MLLNYCRRISDISELSVDSMGIDSSAIVKKDIDRYEIQAVRTTATMINNNDNNNNTYVVNSNIKNNGGYGNNSTATEPHIPSISLATTTTTNITTNTTSFNADPVAIDLVVVDAAVPIPTTYQHQVDQESKNIVIDHYYSSIHILIIPIIYSS